MARKREELRRTLFLRNHYQKFQILANPQHKQSKDFSVPICYEKNKSYFFSSCLRQPTWSPVSITSTPSYFLRHQVTSLLTMELLDFSFLLVHASFLLDLFPQKYNEAISIIYASSTISWFLGPYNMKKLPFGRLPTKQVKQLTTSKVKLNKIFEVEQDFQNFPHLIWILTDRKLMIS